MTHTRYQRFFEQWLEAVITFFTDEAGKSFIKVEFSGHSDTKEASIGDLEILLKEANIPFENNKFEYKVDNEKANRFIEVFNRF